MLRRCVYILFWLPALISNGITCCASPSRSPLLRSKVTLPAYRTDRRSSFGFSWRIERLRKKHFVKYFALALCIFLSAAGTNAQTTDTTVVDTVSFANADSGTGITDEESYIDTTVKHIYDTSEYFFNAKKYSGDPYAYEKILQRSLSDSTIQQLKGSKDFWYIPAIEKLERRIKNDPAFRDSLLKAANKEFTEDKNNFTQQGWFNRLLWCIIIGIFLAALVYFLAQNKINLFSKQSLVSGSETSADDENADIFHIQYAELLRKAEKEENYRSAVRLFYLQTLKQLSEAGFIQYQPDYTNLQYVQQLYKSSLYENFFHVTRHYEFVWYGKFAISKTLYEKLKNDFLTLQNKLAA